MKMARPVASSVAVPSVVVPDLNVTVSPTRSSVRPPLIVAVNVAGWPTLAQTRLATPWICEMRLPPVMQPAGGSGRPVLHTLVLAAF